MSLGGVIQGHIYMFLLFCIMYLVQVCFEGGHCHHRIAHGLYSDYTVDEREQPSLPRR